MKPYLTLIRKSTLILSISVILFLIHSCKTTEYITRVETEYITVRDTVRIESEVIEKETQKTEKEITRETKSDLFLPCPESDEKGSEGMNSSGDNYSKWKYNEERGGYDVELYCAAQISVKDSINYSLEMKLKEYRSRESEREKESIENVKTVKENSGLWAKIMKGIWKVLFFVILVLWLFGITPKFIFKKLIR